MSTIDHAHNKELLQLFYSVYLCEEDCEDTHAVLVPRVNHVINNKKNFAPFHITDLGILADFCEQLHHL